MIYFEVVMIEHDKWFDNHHKELKRFKTKKEAAIYAKKMKQDYWKVDIQRINTKNPFDTRIYIEINGKWKKVI